MAEYNLKKVADVYSYYGKSRIVYSLSNSMTFFGKERLLRKKAVQHLSILKSAKILDIACGMGHNFPYLIDKIGNSGSIIGIDYVPQMLKNAQKMIQKNRWSNVTLICEDAAAMNFPKNYFDAVISTIGLSAIPDHRAAIQRAIVSLKKGGSMVVLDGKNFEGRFQIFNPLLYGLRWDASWDKKKNIRVDVACYFKKVHIEYFLGGSVYILSGTKE